MRQGGGYFGNAKGCSGVETTCVTCSLKESYVMSKLTLHVPEDLVVAAKSEAAARHVSVSKLVSDFFASLAAKSTASASATERLAPRTRRLAKCIPEAKAETEDYIDYLERKHS